MAGSILGSRESLLGRFLVGSGSLFREIWDVLGYVWEWFGDVLGWVWEVFEKNIWGDRKIMVFKNVWEYSS